MSTFPKTIDFMGLNEPIGVEYECDDLEIIGDLPAEVEGTFFRAAPDPVFPPISADETALSGDGMVSKLEIRDGKARYEIKFVKTARYLAEQKAGRAIFGRYRNPYTDLPEAKGIDRTVSNTTPVFHAGRLLMTKEDGRAYEVDPATLETIGSYDFDGALESETMTAHVRIDPQTNEMFFFGYEAGGLCTRDVAYCIADKNGKLISEQWFEAPYCSLMHDFAITENYALFPVFPTTSDLERVKKGGAHWIHEPDLESWVGFMPRYGSVKDIKWVKGQKGVSVFHFMNAFEQDGKIHMDLYFSDTNAFPFIRAASGIDIAQQDIKGGFARWTIDPDDPDAGVAQTMMGPPGDMPRIADADQGRPYRVGWYLSINPEGGPPLSGGPVGVCFNMLVRFDAANGALRFMGLPPDHAIAEPVHIPSQKEGHSGWLISIVDHMLGEGRYEHEAWVIDGDNIEAGAVARIKIPARMRQQVHGWWVPAAAL